MATHYQIKVSFSSFPSYTPVLNWYNEHKPADWQPIAEAGRCEGGFEVRLTAAELDALRQRNRTLDPNDYFRQLEWHRRALRQHQGYAALRGDEIVLLGKALQAVFGEDKVEIIETVY
jgi:hypothetical protein